jgi:hypothetical protein
MYDFAQNIKGGFEKRQSFTPYFFAGVAFANHEPLARSEAINGVVSKEWVRLRELDTEGQSGLGKKQYSTIAFAIPFGMGFRYKINNQLDFSAEGGLRPTFGSGGKYLDDVSGDYIPTAGTSIRPTDSEKFSYRAPELYAARTGDLRDVNKVNPMPLTRDLTTGNALQRGNGRQDWYFITCFQLNYYIPKNIKCPTPN